MIVLQLSESHEIYCYINIKGNQEIRENLRRKGFGRVLAILVFSVRQSVIKVPMPRTTLKLYFFSHVIFYVCYSDYYGSIFGMFFSLLVDAPVGFSGSLFKD